MSIWDCKIGSADVLPKGADAPMRQAVREAYLKITGKEPDFIFSGWDGKLSQAQLTVVTEKANP